MASLPVIPQYIRVHLGRPDDNAKNVTVTFPDYIKNVASSEIYPTWPETAIIANVYAQISYALNRVFLEYYPSRGYNFDITNSTAFDQSFQYGRNIFGNINTIVDRIFNTYIKRVNTLEPLPAEYCNGTTVTCDGLSQWGTVNLANQGYVPYNILTYYYGDDIDLVQNTPIRNISESYPGTPVKLGDRGENVTIVQAELNRISQNYPSIPKIYPVDGVFGVSTERSVKKFQSIFQLAQDGIVGRGTWYQLVYIYVGVKRLTELESEGQNIFGLSLEYPDAVKEGDTGEKVTISQYFLSFLADYYLTVPFTPINGVFGEITKNSVIGFQKQFNLPETGVLDEKSWDVLYDAYKGIIRNLEETTGEPKILLKPYPGQPLKKGDTGENVKSIQQYLNYISLNIAMVEPVNVTGVFGQNTENSVKSYQKSRGLPITGVVNKETWRSIAAAYASFVSAITPQTTQYPGFNLKEGDKDHTIYQNPPQATGTPIRNAQGFLRSLSTMSSDIRRVVPDGIFGKQTTVATRDFQQLAGIVKTGIINWETWNKLVEYVRNIK